MALSLRRRRRERGTPVVAYAMGRSGNTSIADAVRQARVGPVLHVHVALDLYSPEEIEGFRRAWRAPVRPLVGTPRVGGRTCEVEG